MTTELPGREYLAANDALWLRCQLDDSMPESFLLAARKALDTFAADPNNSVALSGFTALPEDLARLHNRLEDIRQLAHKNGWWFAASIARSWSASIRLALCSYPGATERAAATGRAAIGRANHPG